MICRKKHKKTKFILIEGTPKNDKKDEKIETIPVPFILQWSRQVFLAGYAAVKEGYRQQIHNVWKTDKDEYFVWLWIYTGGRVCS